MHHIIAAQRLMCTLATKFKRDMILELAVADDLAFVVSNEDVIFCEMANAWKC